MKKSKGLAMVAAVMLAVGNTAAAIPFQTTSAAYGTGNNIVENLNRGISAINTGSGMLVSWRFLANDADDAVFKLYRDNTLIYTSNSENATCFLDKSGNSRSSYRVDTLSGNTVISSDSCSLISDKNYIDIPMNVPAGGADYTYSPNDCSVGDVDGDGTYEIFVKWDPSNSKDNSHWGVSGNVYIDCYRLDGTQLWRVDLGKNIRAGAHYTQFLVADFDCDGKAEMTCKTGDGTVDGVGNVIGDPSKDYRNEGGHILVGPEFYTLFDGATGAALDTVNYEYPRGEVSKKTWGDDYGNRCERYLGAVMYCDGVHPSAVSVRGYYTRMTAVAYDVVDKKLVKRWGFDTGYDPSAPGYGDGNHNCMPADVDGDGKQELMLGAVALDDDGSVLWCNEKGHGDAMHLSDFLPDRPGLELWVCHEHTPFGVSLIDASSGRDIFYKDGDKDTGRCCAANIYAGNPGAEFWGARPAGVVMDGNGNSTGIAVPSMNYLIYWDGDLEREIQSGTGITKVNQNKKIDTIFNADGCASNNSTKATPNLTADIFGDWREELVLRTEDNKHLRIYCTTSPTDYRITTLMHDVQYRTQVAGEQTGYNQPAHTSFYLGSDQPLPDRPAVTVGKGLEPLSGRLITNLTVKDSANRYDWHIADGIQNGNKIFGDRDFTFTTLPSQLEGAEMILTACDSKNSTGDLAEFTAAQDMTVLIAIDNRVEKVPDWMSGFAKTTMTAQTSNDVTFDIYSKKVKANDVVSLGSNGQSAYCVNYVVFASDADISEIKGDVNADGVFDISDVVLMQKWILAMPDVKLADWKAGDLCEDNRIDVFDLCLMKRLLVETTPVQTGN